jgi:osmotically-inducible protein OsmY
MARLRLWTLATVALLLSLLEGPGCVDAVPAKTPAHRATVGSAPRGAVQRAADRVIARRVRGAIRGDPFLALAGPVVKVTSIRGVVRLVGRVRTDKERSSMAFKVGQTAGVGGIDDRVTVGNGVEGSGLVRPQWTSR